MTVSTYPHANSPIATAKQWSDIMRLLGASGVVANEYNMFACTTSGGLSVTIDTGKCLNVGVYMENTSTQNVTVATGVGNANPRIDRIVLRLDRTANTLAPAVITGTPAATPAPPNVLNTPTQIDLLLAQVRVNAGSSTITSIVMERTWIAAEQGPWAGNIAQSFVSTSETTASTVPTSLTTAGPSLTIVVPRSGVVLATMAAEITPSASQAGNMFLAATGANTFSGSAYYVTANFGSGTGTITVSRSFVLTGLAPGNTTFLLQYAGTSGFNATFANRSLITTIFP